MGLKASRRNAFYNGAIPCVLLQFDVAEGQFVDREALDRRAAEQAMDLALAGGGEAFLNRLRKNRKTLGRWAQRQGIECYRLYDADIPEYAVAVDVYGEHLHVQEYAPPRSVDPAKAAERMQQIRALLPLALDCPPERIAYKVRERQRGRSQYQKQAARGEWLEVTEGAARLWVNLHDYLDTGLFLDHRPTRMLIGELARGRHFLNLFCYTGAATVHAALGGAASTTSLDLSATYLDWAGRNLALNGIAQGGPWQAHKLVRADGREWVKTQRRKFDLIFLDPPTFSASKRMSRHLGRAARPLGHAAGRAGAAGARRQPDLLHQPAPFPARPRGAGAGGAGAEHRRHQPPDLAAGFRTQSPHSPVFHDPPGRGRELARF